ncbi:MAG: hypothetical protein GC164_16060 [Phycisphaera sp.]|nr:hypothetical protein [Phycisphaera sp.]
MNGPFTNQLGLSLFIEHELHGLPVPERIKRTGDQASEQAWQNGQLDLLTTDELISRLYQRPGPWVLGLMRQAPKEQHLQAGTFYRGDPIACAGLAGHLGWLIAKNVLHNRLRRCERSSEPIDAVRDLVDLITSRIDDGHPQVLFISGQSILLEHALRATLKSRR